MRLQASWAPRWRRAAIAGLTLCLLALAGGQAAAETRSLRLYNIHTDERATIVFKRNGVYDQAGLRQINQFMRDWRKGEPTKIDPQLLDLVWEAYRLSGSRDYIHIVSGYRSPATNNMLRRMSSGVAENSLHMAGRAMDFYLPDVQLATLRKIGLTMQSGGVGYYPASGAPFIHLDTGSVRHWPRMTRQQLVQVFPNGATLHIPSDGKPLPGYNDALADYNTRKASSRGVAIASTASAATADPIVVALIAPRAAPPVPTPSPNREVVAVASYSTVPAPVPRLAPRSSGPPQTLVASAEPSLAPTGAATPTVVLASTAFVPDFNFGPPQTWSAPPVPLALAEAMAERDTSHAASLPIAPSAVVTTVDVPRPLRTAAITTAVLRQGDDAVADAVPPVLAYAPLDAFTAGLASSSTADAEAVPLPEPSPLRIAATDVRAPEATPAAEASARLHAPALTLTALDTQGLRLWMGSGSTRQKHYALLTMPDFTQSPDLIDKPEASLGAGFGRTAYTNLRTDHFAGPTVVQPIVVDLGVGPTAIAAR